MQVASYARLGIFRKDIDAKMRVSFYCIQSPILPRRRFGILNRKQFKRSKLMQNTPRRLLQINTLHCFSSFSFLKQTLLPILLVLLMSASRAKGTNLFCHFQANPDGSCGTFISFDVGYWPASNITVEIGDDYMPGNYVFTRPNGYNDVSITVDDNGNYSASYGDFPFGTVYATDAGVGQQIGSDLTVSSKPTADAVATITGTPFFRGPDSCDNDSVGERYGATVTIKIGTSPDKGQIEECHPNTGDCPSCAGDPMTPSNPMATYFIHLMLVSLHIEDTPIAYKSPVGPSPAFRVAYNQREANQPTTFDYSNLGPKWTFDWLSYVKDNPADPSADANVYIRGGGTEVFTGFDPDTQSYVPDKQTLAGTRPNVWDNL